MSFLAPYTNAMRIGQGFNSYTQEICIENAVLIEPARKASSIREKRSTSVASRRSSPGPTPLHLEVERSPPRRPHSRDSLDTSAADDDRQDAHTRRKSTGGMPDLGQPLQSHSVEGEQHKNVVQIVNYSSRLVDNVSEIVEALNISSSASIKYGTVKAAGSASFVNESKIESSDLNYVVTVKVTNQTSPIADKMTFNPIPELDNAKFTEVFGDCFISGFTEGGEFSAIISIKVSDKSKVSAVKAAAEAEIAIPAVPGMEVGVSNKMERAKSDVWEDTETTIAVSWAGGGDLKPPDDKWDIATVAGVASRFPHLVETCAQRTSAILTRYTSLRSFNELNTRNAPDDKFQILDYDLCSLYTQELFSAYLSYKSVWSELSEILKHPEQYQEREPSHTCPDPILLTPKSLSEARMIARKGLTQITEATKALETEPSLADLDENGQMRKPVYEWPGELKKRMPKRHVGPTVREKADFARRDTSFANLSGGEVSKIDPWIRDLDLEFSDLVGDHITSSSSAWQLKKQTDTMFCTLDVAKSDGSSSSAPSHPDDLTRVRFHAYECRSINWLGMFGGQTRAKKCHGHLAGIGFSTALHMNKPSAEHGTHRVAGKANPNARFWSQPVADLRYTKASKVKIEYVPGSGCIASLVLMGPSGQELTSWKMYGQAKAGAPEGMKVVEQEAPDKRGYALVGFWGHADKRVITKVGAIWKKI